MKVEDLTAGVRLLHPTPTGRPLYVEVSDQTRPDTLVAHAGELIDVVKIPVLVLSDHDAGYTAGSTMELTYTPATDAPLAPAEQSWEVAVEYRITGHVRVTALDAESAIELAGKCHIGEIVEDDTVLEAHSATPA